MATGEHPLSSRGYADDDVDSHVGRVRITSDWSSCSVPRGQTITLEEWHRQQAGGGTNPNY